MSMFRRSKKSQSAGCSRSTTFDVGPFGDHPTSPPSPSTGAPRSYTPGGGEEGSSTSSRGDRVSGAKSSPGRSGAGPGIRAESNPSSDVASQASQQQFRPKRYLSRKNIE